ncbi:MAG: DNA repair protein RadC [Fimbriimonadaceae bacterium]|nr:DNA repair protein RadC [Fimbriimonadaceae bacterium]
MSDDAIGRVNRLGVGASAVADLLTVGLSRHAEDVPVAERHCRELLMRLGSVHHLRQATREDFARVAGLTDFEVLRVQALLELGRRMAESARGPRAVLDDFPEVLAQLTDLRNATQERVVVLLLDSKLQLIRRADVHLGTVDASLIGAREIFREAILAGAAQIILAHNHPSGDPTPSPEDIRITRQLREVGKLLDIPLVDHVVVGAHDAISMKRRGLM